MNRMILFFLLAAVPCTLAGCAHRYSEQEYRAVKSGRDACLEEKKAVTAEKERLTADLGRVRSELESARSSAAEGISSRQELLDRNIQCMEENQALLKQISRFKTLTQERKDALSRLNRAHDALASSLGRERDANLLYLVKTEGSVTIVIPQSSLFVSEFSAWLTPKGGDLVRRVASSIRDIRPVNISVSGHTDGQPLPPSAMKTYPTQWDLAMARAVSVLNALLASGIDKEKLQAVSHADTRPVADNKTEAGRAMNRRVEIGIIP